MKLETCVKWKVGLIAGTALCMVIGTAARIVALTWIALALTAVLLAIHFLYWRCPHCKGHLRNLALEDCVYCPHCGKKLEE